MGKTRCKECRYLSMPGMENICAITGEHKARRSEACEDNFKPKKSK